MNKKINLALEALRELTPSYDLSKIDQSKKLHLHGVGKSALRMAREVEGLGLEFESTLIIGPHGGHPIPNEKSIEAARELLLRAKGLNQDDFVIFLLSGGASALMELPIEGIGLEQLQSRYKELLLSKKSISEINRERKEISQVKKGKLGETYLPAKVHCFVESDVEGDLIEDIGSDPIIGNSAHTYSISLSKQSLERKLKELFPEFYIEEINGELGGNIEKHLELLTSHKNLLTLGECSVNVLGRGKGGRNTHWTACMALELLKQNKKFELLSFGSDGKDAATDAAGAFCLGELDQKELADSIADFDTYSFFEKNKMLIKTGPTGHNLNDIRLITLI